MQTTRDHERRSDGRVRTAISRTLAIAEAAAATDPSDVIDVGRNAAARPLRLGVPLGIERGHVP